MSKCNERIRQLVRLLEANPGGMSPRQIRDELGLTEAITKRTTQYARKLGHVFCVGGRGNSARWCIPRDWETVKQAREKCISLSILDDWDDEVDPLPIRRVFVDCWDQADKPPGVRSVFELASHNQFARAHFEDEPA